MFDLATLDLGALASKGQRCELRHPVTGEPLGEPGARPTLLLGGEDSPAYRDAVLETQQRRLNERPEGEKPHFDLVQAAIDRRGWTVAVTVGWEHIALDGEPVPFSKSAAHALYSRLDWVHEQAKAFIAERSHFLPAAPTS